MVRVHLPPQLRKLKGQRVLEIELAPEGTLEDLIQRLAKETDERFARLEEIGTLGNPWVNGVILNDSRLELPRDLHVRLADGDRVYFIHPIAGGSTIKIGRLMN